jgi:E3 ubiquitin-protein ligase HERC4
VDDIVNKLSPSPPDVETLRIYLILPLYHEFNNPRQHLKLHKPFASALLKLGPQASKVIGMWWSTMSSDYFEKLIRNFKSVVSFILRNQRIPEHKTVFYDLSLVAMLDTLTYLNKLNHNVEGLKVPYDTFHISELEDYLDIRVDYFMWLTDSNVSRHRPIWTIRNDLFPERQTLPLQLSFHLRRPSEDPTLANRSRTTSESHQLTKNSFKVVL